MSYMDSIVGSIRSAFGLPAASVAEPLPPGQREVGDHSTRAASMVAGDGRCPGLSRADGPGIPDRIEQDVIDAERIREAPTPIAETPHPVSEYRVDTYMPAEYSTMPYTPAGPEAAPAEVEPAAELHCEQRVDVGPSADDYEQLAASYRAWAREAHTSSLDDRARQFNSYAHFYDRQATKLRNELAVDAAIAATDANGGHEESGSITDVIVEEQMSAAGRSAYWQAISEGATPDQAYNGAEAVEYQERRAAEAADTERKQAHQETAGRAWGYDMSDTRRAATNRG